MATRWFFSNCETNPISLAVIATKRTQNEHHAVLRNDPKFPRDGATRRTQISQSLSAKRTQFGGDSGGFTNVSDRSRTTIALRHWKVGMHWSSPHRLREHTTANRTQYRRRNDVELMSCFPVERASLPVLSNNKPGRRAGTPVPLAKTRCTRADFADYPPHSPGDESASSRLGPIKESPMIRDATA